MASAVDRYVMLDSLIGEDLVYMCDVMRDHLEYLTNEDDKSKYDIEMTQNIVAILGRATRGL